MSEPAPKEIICFGVVGSVERNWWTSLSIAVVRTYVPITLLQIVAFRW